MVKGPPRARYSAVNVNIFNRTLPGWVKLEEEACYGPAFPLLACFGDAIGFRASAYQTRLCEPVFEYLATIGLHLRASYLRDS